MFIVVFPYRDAPEATGEEPDDADFDMPKVYEPVRLTMSYVCWLLYWVSPVYIPAGEEITTIYLLSLLSVIVYLCCLVWPSLVVEFGA